MKRCFNIKKNTEWSVQTIWWGLHRDIVECKGREPCAGCKMDGEEGRHSWDYSKERWIEVVSREQTFPSSEHTTQHPSAQP